MTAYRLVCTDCGASYGADDADYLCPVCGRRSQQGWSPLGVLRCEFDASRPLPALPDAGRLGAARWAALLPLRSHESLPPLPVGPSPLLRVDRLAREIGLPGLLVKDDTGLPTGSLKDRASCLVVAKAREKGRDTVTTASTGNAAVAMAAMCASAGLRAVIFCPAKAPPAKIAQMLAFGATVIPIVGTYDDAYAVSLEITRRHGWYNRSTAWNPFTIEGKKTVAFEIWEQLGRRAPDAVVVPTGDGVILAGVHKGFSDLVRFGLCDRVPRLIAAQAAGSDAIAKALEESGDDVRSIGRAVTLADSISVATPAAGRWAKRAIRETGGAAVTVPDEAIVDAIARLGRTSGVFAEPAASAAIAATIRGVEIGLFTARETVVALVTGTGLKDVEAIRRAVSFPEPADNDVGAVERRLGLSEASA